MSSKNRSDLKQVFQNERILAEKNFADLIDSMLNKREDGFHGIWKRGHSYYKGDVVIHNNEFWVVKVEKTCAQKDDSEPKEGNPDWEHFIIPMDDDGDWKVLKDECVMWAKAFNGGVGIGVGNEQGERPQARLDVRKDGVGSWLLFPNTDEKQAQFNLEYTSCAGNTQQEIEKSCLSTKLTLDEVTWSSNARNGFTFRQEAQSSQVVIEEPSETDEYEETEPDIETEEEEKDPKEPLLVIMPQIVHAQPEIATLGLNIGTPSAVLDIIDSSRGELVFTPHHKTDPVLGIINFDAPNKPKNYVTIGVSKGETALVSDTSRGFVFCCGETYGAYYADKDVKQGESLMRIRYSQDLIRPRVGIGEDYPQACLTVKDWDTENKIGSQIDILPEVSSGCENSTPVISILDLQSDNERYLATGLGECTAGLVSNAKHGFVFRQGGRYDLNNNQHHIDQGNPHFAIREDGRIGIGTPEPCTNLEIVDKNEAGKLLVSLEKDNPALAILNCPRSSSSSPSDSSSNYFTLGADDSYAMLITDSKDGFQFRAGDKCDIRDSQTNINQGDPLVYIRAEEGRSLMGVGTQPKDYELEINGITQSFTYYQKTNQDTMCDCEPLEGVLDRIKCITPYIFRWSPEIGLADEGNQIGLMAENVYEYFDDLVVKEDSNHSKAVAYQNLVPILIQALKELIEEKDQTQCDLEVLQEDFTVYKQQIEEKLERLSEQIQEL